MRPLAQLQYLVEHPNITVEAYVKTTLILSNGTRLMEVAPETYQFYQWLRRTYDAT